MASHVGSRIPKPSRARPVASPDVSARSSRIPSVQKKSPSLASKEEMDQLGETVFSWNEGEPWSFAPRQAGTNMDEGAKKAGDRKIKPMKEVEVNVFGNGRDERRLSIIQDVVFPPLRTVLWDRRPIGEGCVLGADAHVPKLLFRRSVLASLYNYVVAKGDYFTKQFSSAENDFPSEKCPAILGRAINGADPCGIGEWVGGAWQACMQNFHKDGGARKPENLMMQVDARLCTEEEIMFAREIVESGGFENPFVNKDQDALSESLGFSVDDYKRILKDVFNAFRVKNPADPMQFLRGYCVSKALPGNRLTFRCEMILPALTFQFTPVTALPILSTPLARQLEIWARRNVSVDPSDPTACGYLTLNQARKAVFLLEDDPLAHDVPLVGVWLRGSSLPTTEQKGWQRDSENKWQVMLNDPLLWSVCLRYVHNESIKEKVSPPDSPTTFMVIVYPSNSTFPCFLECKYSMYQEDGSATLASVGIHPRPFVQLECGFSVDVSPDGKYLFPGGDGHEADSISTEFYHVENINRRQAFQKALSSLQGENEIVPEEDNKYLNHHNIDSMYLRPERDDEAEAYEMYRNSKVSSQSKSDDHIFCQSSEELGLFDDEIPVAQESNTIGESRLLFQSDHSEEYFNGNTLASVFGHGPPPDGGSDEKEPSVQKPHAQQQAMKAPESEVYFNLITAQQQQISMMQQQIMGLQKLMEQQLSQSNMLQQRIRDSGTPNQEKVPPHSPIVETTQASTKRTSEATTAVYLGGLQQGDEEPSQVYASQASQTRSKRASEAATAVYLGGLQQDDEEPSQIYSYGEKVDSSQASIEKEEDGKPEKMLTVPDETSSIYSPPSPICGGSGKKTNKPSPPSSPIVLNVPKREVESSIELTGESANERLYSSVLNELDTAVGIPNIVSADLKLDEDESAIFDTQEDDEWLASVEAKYLRQAKAS